MEGSSLSSCQIVTFYLIIISLMLLISGSVRQEEDTRFFNCSRYWENGGGKPGRNEKNSFRRKKRKWAIWKILNQMLLETLTFMAHKLWVNWPPNCRFFTLKLAERSRFIFSGNISCKIRQTAFQNGISNLRFSSSGVFFQALVV